MKKTTVQATAIDSGKQAGSLLAEEPLEKPPPTARGREAVNCQRHDHAATEQALREVPRRVVPGQRHWEERVKRGIGGRVRPETKPGHQEGSEPPKQDVVKHISYV